MEIEEKAREIYDKMKGFRVKNTHRKKCSLNLVNEMIRELKEISFAHDMYMEEDINYWERVKLEIEKL